jgi:prefoldin subunit 5
MKKIFIYSTMLLMFVSLPAFSETPKEKAEAAAKSKAANGAAASATIVTPNVCPAVPIAVHGLQTDITQTLSTLNKMNDDISTFESYITDLTDVNANIKTAQINIKKGLDVLNTIVPLTKEVKPVNTILTIPQKTLKLVNDGLTPAAKTIDDLINNSGLKTLQNELDQKVKPTIAKIVNDGKSFTANVKSANIGIETICNQIQACVNYPNGYGGYPAINPSAYQAKIIQQNEAVKLLTTPVNDISQAAQDITLVLKVIDDIIVKVNTKLAFIKSYTQRVKSLDSTLNNIVNPLDQVDNVFNQKITISILTFNESFTVRQAFNDVASIIDTINKIPFVSDVENVVESPIQVAMNVVTEPLQKAEAQLEKDTDFNLSGVSLSISSDDLNSFNKAITSFQSKMNDLESSISEVNKWDQFLYNPCK